MLRVAADYLRETGTTHTTTAFEPGPYPVVQQGVEDRCTRHDLDRHVRAYQRYPKNLKLSERSKVGCAGELDTIYLPAQVGTTTGGCSAFRYRNCAGDNPQANQRDRGEARHPRGR